jgi:glycosyltransferase involved in cell wall biosynthesis
MTHRVLHVMRMKGVAGSERHLLELSRALRPLGWRSDAVIASPEPEALRGYAASLADAGGGRVTVVRTTYDLSAALIRHLQVRLRHERPDVLHSHLVHADWHAALAAARRSDTAVVSSKHNHDPFRTGTAYKVVERLAARRSDAMIAISSSLADFTATHTGRRPCVVHYGLPAPPVPPARDHDRPLRLLAVGRLEEQKGHDVLIEAFASIAGGDAGLRLLISGEGSRRGRLFDLAAGLGVAEQVQFLGWRSDVEVLLVEAALLVHPARWEGFGLVILEAMAAALPVVATRVGAIPEIVIDGETGLLVDPEDARGLAIAMRSLLHDRKRRVELGTAGFDRLREEFSPRRMAAGTVAVYERALAARSAACRSREDRRRSPSSARTATAR